MDPRVDASAFAKVNLTLRVLGRRDDGFHALSSVVMPLALHDDISVVVGLPENAPGGARGEAVAAGGVPGPCVAVEVVPDGVDCAAIGPPDKNLCARAAQGFWARLPADAPLRRADSVTIRVTKRIPIGGGLGGGSADAAAALRALNALAGESRLGEEALRAVAAEIGSDVPALLTGGPVLMEGRGEKVTPLDASPFAPLPVLLANPGIPVSTPAAYAEYDRVAKASRPCGETDGTRPLPCGSPRGLALPGDYARILSNDLEAPVFGLCPAVAETARALRAAGARAVLMSGSGATIFAICATQEEAAHLAEALPATAWRAITRLAPDPPAPAAATRAP